MCSEMKTNRYGEAVEKQKFIYEVHGQMWFHGLDLKHYH